ncbi:MAG TPA: acyl-CoA reductase [Thermoanaerobaculia bacterium]|nr:acyl-CoA reductase [Thermoanaerobaculia bacterium]
MAGRGAAALASVPPERRLAAWNGAIEALLDPESEERRELFPALLGTARLSLEGLTEALEVVLGGWRGEAAARLAARATGIACDPTPVGALLAANVPGLAAQCVLPALLAGRPLLIKSSTAEPLFAPALLDALTAREPALRDAFAAVAFPGESTPSVEAFLRPAHRVLAFGAETSIRSLRATFGARLVAHGAKLSVALVGRDVDPLAVGRGLARDVALLDQRGCLSVHAVFVEGDARELAETLAFGLAIERRRLPPGPVDPEVAALVQQWRGAADLAGALVGDLDPLEGSVILAGDAELRPSPGMRTVRVHAVESIRDALGALTPWQGRLQGAALAGAGAVALGPELEALGVSRLAEPGELQAAEAGWANGGVDPFELFA